MKDEHKTKEQLMEELVELRQRIAELEALEVQHKRTEEALRGERDRMQKYLDIAGVIIVAIDADQRVTLINRKGCEVLGYDEDEIVGRNWFDNFLPERMRDEVRSVSEKLLAGEIEPVEYFENPILTKSGDERFIAWHNTILKDQEGESIGHLSLGNDITERKQAEEEIRQLKEFNESIVQGVAEAILIEDADGILTFANLAAEELLGYNHEELMGLHWSAVVPEDQRAKVRQELEKRPQGAGSRYETALLSKEGQGIPVIVSARPLFEEGKFVGVLSAFTDITEHKRMEERIRGQDRLAAVGQLAAGIAHDFNNILTSMIGFAELLHMREDVPESAKVDLKYIMEAGHRAAYLIRQILDFSRKSLISRQPLDLAPFLKDAVKFLQRTIPESIPIVLEMEADQYLVNADPTQIQQALINLAVNARDAMTSPSSASRSGRPSVETPGGRELRLRLARFTLKPDDRRPFPSMEPGDWITLSVSDTGVGIPPEVLPHLYEPFFTTKPGEGTGLGLAQVYGIVKQHDGFIDVETQVGKGTTFIIFLPPLAARKEAPREGALEEMPRGQGETVLMVEDEPQVLTVSRAMLEHLGYRVLMASTGVQALDLYDRHREEVALVLVDMVMPKMGGMQLFQALRAWDPEVKVVLMTGYPLAEEGRELLEQGIVGWLQKPLDIVQLGRVVSRALR